MVRECRRSRAEVKGEEALAGIEIFEDEATGAGPLSKFVAAAVERSAETDPEDARRNVKGGDREPIRTGPEKGQPSGLCGSAGAADEGASLRRRGGEALVEKYLERVEPPSASSEPESRTSISSVRTTLDFVLLIRSGSRSPLLPSPPLASGRSSEVRRR